MRTHLLQYFPCAALALLQAFSFARASTVEVGDSNPAPTVVDESRPPEGLSENDWAEVRDAFGASWHRFAATDDGYTARSPRNGWSALFDGRGFTLAPDAAGWRFGLALERFGIAGSERNLDAPTQACAEGQRLTYDWDADLSEWWVNDARGLEHGFTVHRPPTGEAEGCTLTLVFDLAVRGGLRPSVTTDRRGVRFADAASATVLTYDGLIAFDADGAPLEAWLEADQGRLRIAVRADGARYPITVDPIVQSAYLKASNTDVLDQFGWSVAVSGDTVVVGAVTESSAAVGVNGDQNDDSAQYAGAAYVFVKSGGTWQQQAYLKASNTDANDQFGISVDIAADTVVVGAYMEDSAAVGVDGDQTSNAASEAGAAYVFVRNGVVWQQQAYLKATNSGAGDRFGCAVAVDGDTIVVGSLSEDSAAVGVGGDQASNGASDSGAAYVFVRNGTLWAPQAYLKPSNTGGGDFFGYSVAADEDTIVVGAVLEDSAAFGIDGDGGSNSAGNSGAAYVFRRVGSTWQQESYVKASNTGAGDSFGHSVSLSENTMVIGAYGEDSSAVGVGGDGSNDALSNAGAAYVFVRSGMSWQQQAYLKASNSGASDQFGVAVAVAGNRIVVGAFAERSSATGLNGNQASNAAFDSGAAYAFVRHGVTWQPSDYIKASNTGLSDRFGWSVAVSEETLVVGAYSEASDATGVNGNQASDAAFGSGAVYAFDLIAPGTIGTNFCHPFSLNSSGMAATITATGSSAVLDGDLTLTVDGLPTAGTTAMLINSMSASSTITGPLSGGPAGVASDGRICIGGGHFGRHFLDIYMGNAGTFALALDLQGIPFPEAPGDYSRIVLVGETWFWQCWYRDGALGSGRNNFSDAVAITFE